MELKLVRHGSSQFLVGLEAWASLRKPQRGVRVTVCCPGGRRARFTVQDDLARTMLPGRQANTAFRSWKTGNGGGDPSKVGDRFYGRLVQEENHALGTRPKLLLGSPARPARRMP